MIENHMVLPRADDDAVEICPECKEPLGPLGDCWECIKINRINDLRGILIDIARTKEVK